MNSFCALYIWQCQGIKGVPRIYDGVLRGETGLTAPLLAMWGRAYMREAIRASLPLPGGGGGGGGMSPPPLPLREGIDGPRRPLTEVEKLLFGEFRYWLQHTSTGAVQTPKAPLTPLPIITQEYGNLKKGLFRPPANDPLTAPSPPCTHLQVTFSCSRWFPLGWGSQDEPTRGLCLPQHDSINTVQCHRERPHG